MQRRDSIPSDEALRLIRQLQTRLDVMTAIQRSSQHLSQLRSLESLSREIVKVLEALSFEHAAVLLLDEETGSLTPYAYRGQYREGESKERDEITLATRKLRLGVGVTGWVAQMGKSVRVADVFKDDRYLRVHADSRSELCVPLMVADRVIGVVNVETNRQNAFSEVDQQALETFAGQISVAIQNAQQFEQSRQHTEELEQNIDSRTVMLEQMYRRQAALAEIELSINEPHELEEVLDRITKVTTDLLPATGGVNVILWERETESYFIGATTVPGQVPQTPTQRIRREGGATRWIIQNRQALVVSDVEQDPFGSNRMMTIFFNQAYVGVPLMVGTDVLGVLYAFDVEPREYSQEDLDFLYTLANRAAAAISKVRLFESERRQRKLAETLRAANIALTQILDLNRVLEALLLYLEQLVPYDGANILLMGEDDQIEVRAVRGYDGMIDPESLRSLIITPSQLRTFRTILSSKRSLLIPDTAEYPDWVLGLGTDFIRSWMGVPLLARGKIIGVYSIDSRTPGTFTEDHLRSAEALAAQGAIAIQNAQLFGDVQRLAITDALTGTNNRRNFLDLAQREFNRARRFNRPLSLIMLDIDHFKKVNDTFGHSSGDQVLRTLTQRVLDNIREIDVLGRYGGEEFMILLPETEDVAARRVAERLRKSVIASPFETDQGPIPVTVSLGVVTTDAQVDELDDVIHQADMVMYKAKQAGGNCVVVDSSRKSGPRPQITNR
jgi:diguanylate cyclase (GGDEF)-like protein